MYSYIKIIYRVFTTYRVIYVKQIGRGEICLPKTPDLKISKLITSAGFHRKNACNNALLRTEPNLWRTLTFYANTKFCFTTSF